MRSGLLISITMSILLLLYSGIPAPELAEGRELTPSIQDSQPDDSRSLPDRSFPAPKGDQAIFVAAATSENVVLLVGERGLIFRSTDAGQNFQQVEAPTRRMLCAVTFGDDGMAYAVGHDLTVLRSSDSGASWEAIHRDPEADLALFSVVALEGGRVVAVGAFGTVLVSTDSGENWRQELISEDGPHVYSVQRTATTLVAVGEFGSIFTSDDGGDVWQVVESPYEGTFFHVITFDDSADLVLLGLRGNLWEGAAGNWKRIETGFEASLFGGSNLSAGRVVVVGDEGVLMIRAADGQWEDRSPGERRLLSSAIELPDGAMLILGEKGYRIRFRQPAEIDSGEEGR
ncbi:MAG: YCF48-related protein [Planctomycetota bacterium]